eukprot:gene3221-23764_t
MDGFSVNGTGYSAKPQLWDGVQRGGQGKVFAADGTQTPLREGGKQKVDQKNDKWKGMMHCETPCNQVFSNNGTALTARPPRTGGLPPRPQSPWATTAPGSRSRLSNAVPDAVISEGGALLSHKTPNARGYNSYSKVNRLLDPSIDRQAELSRRGQRKQKNFMAANKRSIRKLASGDRPSSRSGLESPGFSMGRPNTAAAISSSRPGTAGTTATASSSRRPGLGVTGAALYSGGSPASGQQQLRYQQQQHGGDDGWTTASTAPVHTHAHARAEETPRSRTEKSGRPPTSSATSSRPGTGRKTKAGELPAYLVARNKAWADDDAARVKFEEDYRDCPPGHICLPEDERRQHVAVLRQAKAQLENAFSRLSVTSSTARHRRQHADLEAKMAETEAELKFFSKPKVYVLP